MAADSVENLRKRVRFLEIGATGLTILLLAVFVLGMGHGEAEEIRATRFELVDSQGHACAILGIDDEGAVGLAIARSDGRLGARFAVSKSDRPSLELYDRRASIILDVLPGGSPGVRLADETGTARAILSIIEEGNATLAMHDADGKGRVLLSAHPDGGAVLRMDTDNQRGGVAIAGPAIAGGGLILRDENGVVRGGLLFSPSAGPMLSLCDAKGESVFKKP